MMKSKKVRIIELKDPKLRLIRKNLRDIIKFAARKEIRRLHVMQDKYLGKGMTPEEDRMFTKFSRKGDKLMFALSDSIIQCSSGAQCDSYEEAKKHGFNPGDRPTDLDMVWIPYYQKWFCLNCYKSTFYDANYNYISEDPYSDPFYHCERKDAT